MMQAPPAMPVCRFVLGWSARTVIASPMQPGGVCSTEKGRASLRTLRVLEDECGSEHFPGGMAQPPGDGASPADLTAPPGAGRQQASSNATNIDIAGSPCSQPTDRLRAHELPPCDMSITFKGNAQEQRPRRRGPVHVPALARSHVAREDRATAGATAHRPAALPAQSLRRQGDHSAARVSAELSGTSRHFIYHLLQPVRLSRIEQESRQYRVGRRDVVGPGECDPKCVLPAMRIRVRQDVDPEGEWPRKRIRPHRSVPDLRLQHPPRHSPATPKRLTNTAAQFWSRGDIDISHRGLSIVRPSSFSPAQSRARVQAAAVQHAHRAHMFREGAHWSAPVRAAENGLRSS